MSAEEERIKAMEAIRAARSRVANRARIARTLQGDPAAMNQLLEDYAPFWRVEAWEVGDDADLW